MDRTIVMKTHVDKWYYPAYSLYCVDTELQDVTRQFICYPVLLAGHMINFFVVGLIGCCIAGSETIPFDAPVFYWYYVYIPLITFVILSVLWCHSKMFIPGDNKAEFTTVILLTVGSPVLVHIGLLATVISAILLIIWGLGKFGRAFSETMDDFRKQRLYKKANSFEEIMKSMDIDL